MKEIQTFNNGESLHSIRNKINENFETVKDSRNIAYDAIETGMLADNVQDAIDSLGKRINGLNRFCVNEGNYTDDVEDLLGYSGTNLQFKVGGNYPNVLATKSDGTTFVRGTVLQQELASYSDGTYNIFVDENLVEILGNNILTKGQESLAVNNDVLYDSVNLEAKQYKQNGLKATMISNNQQGVGLYGICSNDNIKIIVGGYGYIASSVDGINWTQRTLSIPITTHINDVIYTGTSFVAVGQNLVTCRSTDGISWSVILNGSSTNTVHFHCVAKGNDRIVAAGSTSSHAYSTDDGRTWTTVGNMGYNNIQGIAFGAGKFVEVGDSGYIGTSTNGVDWTPLIMGTQTHFTCIRYMNSEFIATARSGKIFRSQNGTSWSEIPTNITTDILDINLHNGVYCAVGTVGTIYTSTDLSNWTRIRTDVTDMLIGVENNYIVGGGGLKYILEQDNTWVPYTKVPLGTVTISNSTITNVYTFPYNYTPYNGLLATAQTYGLLRVAAVEDEVDCSCNDAGITPSNLYKLNNFRTANTQYQAGDTVGCPYHHNLQLKCTTAGTTSSDKLDTSVQLKKDDTIQDGTVVWTVEEIGTGGINDKITNCLLEVPQNIKYELSDSGFTLKSGSKVIVPNGANVFDEVTISADKTRTWAYNGQGMMFYRKKVDALQPIPARSIYSSATAPTPTINQCAWFDTTNNKVKISNDKGITWEEECSLPLFLLTANGTKITSIDQVFNGIGYIGSQVWVGKGVTVLIPNGRNEDGTLKNISFTQSQTAVMAEDRSGATSIGVNKLGVRLHGNKIIPYFLLENNPYFEQEDKPNVDNQYYTWFDTKNNIIKYTDTYGASFKYGKDTTGIECVIGEIAINAGVISEFSVKQPVKLLTWDDIRINNPYFFGQYIWSEFAPSNLSWLKSSGQWNSGTGYSDFYNWALANANADKTGFKLSTATYTDYDFVVNTTNKTFRLPIKVKGKQGDAVVGTGVALGLTNGTENFGLTQISNDNQKCVNLSTNSYGKAVGSSNGTDSYTSSTNYSVGVVSDPTKSGLELDTTGLSLYFYVGETTKDLGLINVSQLASNIADKVDKTSATDRETVIGWGMPDYSAGIAMSTEINTPQLIQYDGLLLAYENSNYVQIDLCDQNGNTTVPNIIANAGYADAIGGGSAFIRKGQHFKNIKQPTSVILYPLIGAK